MNRGQKQLRPIVPGEGKAALINKSVWLRGNIRSCTWLCSLALLACLGCTQNKKQILELELPEAIDAPELLDPLELLKTACRSLEPSTRAQAIGPLIYRFRNEEWALRGLYDPDSWVQRAAGLELLQLQEYTNLLAYLSGNADPYVRGELAAKLVLHVSDSEQAVLSGLWREVKFDWERPPLALAAATLGDKEAITLIGKALEQGDIALSHHFIATLGRSNRPELLPYLKRGEALAEEELKLPYAAARLALGDSSAQSAFISAFNDPNPEVALEALDHLSVLEAGYVIPLLKRAQSTSDPEIKWYALLALLARHEGNPDKLLAAMSEDNWEVRLWTIRFASTLLADETSSRREQATASRVLERASDDESPLIRGEAAKAMRWVSPDLASRYLPLLLADRDLQVRLTAAASRFYLPKEGS